MLLILASFIGRPAEAFIQQVDICQGNLVVVGTVVNRQSFWSPGPSVLPQHPDGRIYTKVTLQAERTILDEEGAVDVAGYFDIVVPGGTIGPISMEIPERPTMAVGNRYGLSMVVTPQATFPMMLDWSSVDPQEALPTLGVLQQEWYNYCAGVSQ